MRNIIKILLLGLVSLSVVNADVNSTIETTTKASKIKVDSNSSKNKLLKVIKKSKKVDDNKSKIEQKRLVPVVFGKYPVPNMQTDFDGYISAILIDSKGKRSQLLPSKLVPDTYVKKAEATSILDNDSIISQLPNGLHYMLIVISQERLILGITNKDKKYISALEDDTVLMDILESIRLGKYGKFAIKMVPIYK